MRKTRSLWLVGLFSVALVATACTETPADTPGAGATPPGTGDDVLAQLCEPGEEGNLSDLATELDRADDADVDTGQLSQQLTTAQTNLQNLEVDATAQSLRDAAVSGLRDFQQVLEDPDARGEAGRQAAQAVRTLEAQICP